MIASTLPATGQVPNHRATHPHESAHRHADEVHGPDAERADQRHCVLAQRVHVQAGRRFLALALAAVVIGDATETRAERGDLLIPHPQRVEEAVGEHHRRPASTRVFHRELHTVA